MRPRGFPWIAAAALAALAASEPAGAADPLAGRALFIGARPFTAGAPPCGACHAIGGASAPFAAAFGPELSRSFEGLDATAVDGLLQELPFPTMAPLYAGRPLTPEEREDLSAFLRQVTGSPPPGGAAVAGWAALLAAACLGALALLARRVKAPTRPSLRAHAPRAGRSAPARRPQPGTSPAGAAPEARAEGGTP